MTVRNRTMLLDWIDILGLLLLSCYLKVQGLGKRHSWPRKTHTCNRHLGEVSVATIDSPSLRARSTHALCSSSGMAPAWPRTVFLQARAEGPGVTS